jgi:hypothetical protein
LTERELLLLLNQRMDAIEHQVSRMAALELRIHELELKLKMWAFVVGGGSSIAISMLAKFLHI